MLFRIVVFSCIILTLNNGYADFERGKKAYYMDYIHAQCF